MEILRILFAIIPLACFSYSAEVESFRPTACGVNKFWIVKETGWASTGASKMAPPPRAGLKEWEPLPERYFLITCDNLAYNVYNQVPGSIDLRFSRTPILEISLQSVVKDESSSTTIVREFRCIFSSKPAFPITTLPKFEHNRVGLYAESVIKYTEDHLVRDKTDIVLFHAKGDAFLRKGDWIGQDINEPAELNKVSDFGLHIVQYWEQDKPWWSKLLFFNGCPQGKYQPRVIQEVVKWGIGAEEPPLVSEEIWQNLLKQYKQRTLGTEVKK